MEPVVVPAAVTLAHREASLFQHPRFDTRLRGCRYQPVPPGWRPANAVRLECFLRQPAAEQVVACWLRLIRGPQQPFIERGGPLRERQQRLFLFAACRGARIIVNDLQGDAVAAREIFEGAAEVGALRFLHEREAVAAHLAAKAVVQLAFSVNAEGRGALLMKTTAARVAAGASTLQLRARLHEVDHVHRIAHAVSGVVSVPRHRCTEGTGVPHPAPRGPLRNAAGARQDAPEPPRNTVTMTPIPTTITAEPGSPIVTFSREFEATADQLLRAHLDGVLLAQWLGPARLRMEILEMDASHGGRYRFVHHDPATGAAYAFRGVFHGEPTTAGVTRTFEFEGAPGHVSLERLWFEELPGGRTRLRAQATHSSVAARDAMIGNGMQVGVDEGYAKLDALLRTMR
jgi:uncharacterized protein YndB with AHSA1/START domain